MNCKKCNHKLTEENIELVKGHQVLFKCPECGTLNEKTVRVIPNHTAKSSIADEFNWDL